MDVIHYPDDPRPARWQQPVLALGNFDGLHRGHMKIVERVVRTAARAGGDAARAHVRPAPDARRPARQGAAAADDARAEARGARAGRRSTGLAVVRFTPRHGERGTPRRSCALVLVEWLRVAEVWVGANFLFGHDRVGQLLDAARAGRAVRVPGREDRAGALQGVRRVEFARAAADRRGAGGRGGRRCSAGTTSWTASSCTACSGAAARVSDGEPRTARTS